MLFEISLLWILACPIFHSPAKRLILIDLIIDFLAHLWE
ncbi:hypothetical protein EST38_g10621 [Candolleomyces aberdarensis]|uniref:Uncharacterized protein n=1 Tax=Candolleomyces aberdarensis TaxID=2316362 RepID=A0A4Q2D9C4_9AGAR|nr:hypothetical protein EST38_g10621 [Candolleomyces aberdarensis]